MNQIEKPELRLIVLLGQAGAGKDSAGEALAAENPGWAIISTGDRIKQARNPEDEFHHVIAPYEYLIDLGQNLPKEVVLNLDNPRASIVPSFIESELTKGTTTIISTGFPRTVEQYQALKAYLAELGQRVDIRQDNIFLDVSDETVWQRISRRREIYAAQGRPIRSDDSDENIERRLATFKRDTFPLVQLLKNEGVLHQINAEGTIPEVRNLVESALELRPPLEIQETDETSLRRGPER